MFQQFLKSVITTVVVTAVFLFSLSVYNGATGSNVTLNRVPVVGFAIKAIESAGTLVGEKVKNSFGKPSADAPSGT